MIEYDLTQQIDVVRYMRNSTSESDWNNRCDKVKEANNGYPVFWYSSIVTSGVMFETQQRWNNKN